MYRFKRLGQHADVDACKLSSLINNARVIELFISPLQVAPTEDVRKRLLKCMKQNAQSRLDAEQASVEARFFDAILKSEANVQNGKISTQAISAHPRERASTIEAEEETATEDISGEISDLEDQLNYFESQKEDIEQPFASRLGDLAYDYTLGARLVMHTVYRYYGENRHKWPREKYRLGYPEGCILEAVKRQTDIHALREHLDLHEVHDDLIAAFHEIIKNGEFADISKKVWEHVQRNNGHNDADTEGESHD